MSLFTGRVNLSEWVSEWVKWITQHKEAIIHQLTTMISTSKKSYFKVITTCYSQVLMTLHFNYHHPNIQRVGLNIFYWSIQKDQTWQNCDVSLLLNVGSSAPLVSKWLWPGNRTFLEVDSMVVSLWIVAFLPSVSALTSCCLLSSFGSRHLDLRRISASYVSFRVLISPSFRKVTWTSTCFCKEQRENILSIHVATVFLRIKFDGTYIAFDCCCSLHQCDTFSRWLQHWWRLQRQSKAL